MIPGFWGADAEARVASRTPAHGSGGTGGQKRRGPTGGLAYGTPRKTWMPSSSLPDSLPEAVSTRESTLSSPDTFRGTTPPEFAASRLHVQPHRCIRAAPGARATR